MRRYAVVFAFLAVGAVALRAEDSDSYNIKLTKDDKELQNKKQSANIDKIYLETSLTDSAKGRPAKFQRKYTKAVTKAMGEEKEESYQGETIIFELNKKGKYEVKPAGEK